jgi:hypothetical protein
LAALRLVFNLVIRENSAWRAWSDRLGRPEACAL